jgi:hypothetical protein
MLMRTFDNASLAESADGEKDKRLARLSHTRVVRNALVALAPL